MYGRDISKPTAVAPRSAAAAVITPVPHPTFITRWPGRIPAKSRHARARRCVQRAMKISYPAGSLATKVVIPALRRYSGVQRPASHAAVDKDLRENYSEEARANVRRSHDSAHLRPASWWFTSFR